jgi:phenylalanyl-tRNA synthetase beta subunit
LKDSLVENLLYNERRQKDSIKLFEISNLYSKNKHIHQEKKLGIIISGRKGHNYKDFSMKLDNTYLNNLLNKNTNNFNFIIEEISRSNLKTKKKEKIYYTEISIDNIPNYLFEDSKPSFGQINFIKHRSVSEFPSSTRDFSFLIKNIKKYDVVINHFSDLNDKHLKDAYIFDFYKNKKLNEIKVGIRFIFQSNLKTLSEEDIQKSVNRLLKPVIDLEGISIPGFY